MADRKEAYQFNCLVHEMQKMDGEGAKESLSEDSVSADEAEDSDSDCLSVRNWGQPNPVVFTKSGIKKIRAQSADKNITPRFDLVQDRTSD